MKHYTSEKLELYRHRQMGVLGRIQCASHLKECAECRERLAELQADDQLVAELRESVRIYKELSNMPLAPDKRTFTE